jgi:hypothetical protein
MLKPKYDLSTPEGRAGFQVEVPRERLIEDIIRDLEPLASLVSMVNFIDQEPDDSDTNVSRALEAIEFAIEMLESELISA